MANNFDSNFTRKLMRSFLDKFESSRVLSKNVDTQMFQGKFNGSTGDTIDVKRPTDYKTLRTANGDVSGGTASSIITGKASATVQDYFTVFVDYEEADEALKMDQIDELLAPMVTRVVTDFEVDFAKFMMTNTALLAGDVGTAIGKGASADPWDDVATAGALMQSSGIPQDGMWCYAVNPFAQRKLAGNQRSLGGEVSSSTSNQMATIQDNFAGMKVLTATTLANYTTGVGADRAGTVVGVPVATYVAAKDTMTQVVGVTAFQANLVVKAGETVTITGRNRLNLSTREVILDEDGAPIVWTATVTTDVTLGAAGEGNLTLTGPAIFEATGAYNTVDSAIQAADVITLGGAASTIIQPNLFWHKQAFTIASVPIKRLHSTDTFAETEDGIQVRVSKGSNFLENENKVRIDFRPAYGALNQFFAGQGFGNA